MRDIEELRAIANKRNQTLETLLYEMLVDAMAENQKYKEAFDKVTNIIENDYFSDDGDFEGRVFQNHIVNALKEGQ